VTSLALTQMFINLASTGAFVSGGAAVGRVEDNKINGSVNTYASGRQRAITTAGVVGTFTFQLRNVSRATINTLNAWINQTVQVRDSRGHRIFGVYLELSIEEVTMAQNSWCATKFDTLGAWHVTIVLLAVTYVEAV